MTLRPSNFCMNFYRMSTGLKYCSYNREIRAICIQMISALFASGEHSMEQMTYIQSIVINLIESIEKDEIMFRRVFHTILSLEV